jgi:hypothetical protein
VKPRDLSAYYESGSIIASRFTELAHIAVLTGTVIRQLQAPHCTLCSQERGMQCTRGAFTQRRPPDSGGGEEWRLVLSNTNTIIRIHDPDYHSGYHLFSPTEHQKARLFVRVIFPFAAEYLDSLLLSHTTRERRNT